MPDRQIFAIACCIAATSVASSRLIAGDLPVWTDTAKHAATAHCFDCHADGAAEGGLSFDDLLSGAYGDETEAKWVAVWKNLRAETMPPADAGMMPAAERENLKAWIEDSVFRLDPDNPDPGVVTARRLNREEYRNAVRELLGVSFDVEEEFPADDTGYGFDTIGDVLNMSPVLFEKYLAAADEIATKAIPLNGPSLPVFGFWGDHWKGGNTNELPFDKASSLRVTKKVPAAGTYRIKLDYEIDNAWTRATETVVMTLSVERDGELERVAEHTAGWDSRKASELRAEVALEAGPVTFQLDLRPGAPHKKPADIADAEDVRYEVRIAETQVEGPVGGPRTYRWPATNVFFNGPPPPDRNEAVAYAREIIQRHASLAFRRPLDTPTLDRLVDVATAEMDREGQRFEHGIKAALTLVLASPRFLFRTEGQPHPNDPGEIVALDDFEVASRLAFFLWSSPPDRWLHERAKEGKVIDSLDETIDRMLSEEWRLKRFVHNFVGQWLQIGDIHEIESNERAILGREHPDVDTFSRRRWQIRSALRQETESLFEYLLVEGRPVEELLTAKYSFLNKYSARFYGIDGVTSDKYEKVDLPAGSHRRGILTHGSVLLVTSNPTRTSPVKRGLFVLENLLGAPAPAAPPDVPELEAVTSIDIRTAPLRQVLEAHRENPECASCHQRMDPLGLALEHFDALGAYRDVERARKAYRNFPATPEKPIDVSGTLLTGESFDSLDQLIDILASTRRRDLYRCLTEKLMTFALGRGIEYTDATVIDDIVDSVEQDNGSLQSLVRGIANSKPFLYRRGAGPRARIETANKN